MDIFLLLVCLSVLSVACLVVVCCVMLLSHGLLPRVSVMYVCGAVPDLHTLVCPECLASCSYVVLYLLRGTHLIRDNALAFVPGIAVVGPEVFLVVFLSCRPSVGCLFFAPLWVVLLCLSCCCLLSPLCGMLSPLCGLFNFKGLLLYLSACFLDFNVVWVDIPGIP